MAPLIEMLRPWVSEGLSPKQAGEKFKKAQEALGALSEEQTKRIEEAVRAYEDRIGEIQVLKPAYVIGKARQPWYAGPVADRLWGAYRGRLETQLGWDESVIENIDRTSTRIVSLLDNPGVEKFSTRGLVVGYVQSGKTANLTAVAAKAADAGYRMIVILAGLTNALREQTQERMRDDLFSSDTDSLEWAPLTSRDHDFRSPPAGRFQPQARQIRAMAVVKKNTFILQSLLRTIERTDVALLRRTPVLVIDDECDQASVNASAYSEDMTRINELVRRLLGALPKVAYIGYTATPFANVLIDPSVSVEPGRLDDLYPKDFIVSLPLPLGYFGAERLFGRDLLSAEDTPSYYEDLDQMRCVPDDEAARLRPSRQNRKEFTLEITPSLRRSLLYFLLASAIRDLRGHQHRHYSMLVHTTVYTDPHFAIQRDLAIFLTSIRSLLVERDVALLEELSRLLQQEQSRLPPVTFGKQEVDLSELLSHLEGLLEQVEIVVENGRSDQRIDFTEVEDSELLRGRRYIVVGGNVLARGLTLEGLMVSYFLRTSSQYDTVMQMGRWFGYRPGYEDLPRIWMTEDMRRAFKNLATVEAEIREDIAVYDRADYQLTPMEFAVRIRQIPGMAITQRNKMRSASPCQISYSGQHKQTTSFRHLDEGWLASNWAAGSGLLERAIAAGAEEDQSRRKGVVLRGVPFATILDFLESYSIHPRHTDLESSFLRQYILDQNERADGSLSQWNIAIVPGQSKATPKKPLGPFSDLRMVVRSAWPPEFTGDADIKALMSRGDVLIDFTGPNVPRASEPWKILKEARESDSGAGAPLLLLYPIDPESKPRRESRNRRSLNAVGDVLGMGIVFPVSPIPTPLHYVRAPIPDLDEDFDEEYEQSKPALGDNVSPD